MLAVVLAAALTFPQSASARPTDLYPPPPKNPWHLLFLKNRALRHQHRLIVKLKSRIASLTSTPTPTSAPSSSVGGGVRAFLLCVHPYEEPSWNTVAGGLGFVYPPTSYGGIAATLAQTYGNSWTNWPEEAQLQVGAMLYAKYGTSPWSTAYHCS